MHIPEYVLVLESILEIQQGADLEGGIGIHQGEDCAEVKLQLDLTQKLIFRAGVGARKGIGLMGSIGKRRGHIYRKWCPRRCHGAIVARLVVK